MIGFLQRIQAMHGSAAVTPGKAVTEQTTGRETLMQNTFIGQMPIIFHARSIA